MWFKIEQDFILNLHHFLTKVNPKLDQVLVQIWTKFKPELGPNLDEILDKSYAKLN